MSRDLELGLLKVIVVKMGITQCMNKNTGFQIAYLRHHVREECVGGDVERDAQKHISASLVELTVQSPLGTWNWKKA